MVTPVEFKERMPDITKIISSLPFYDSSLSFIPDSVRHVQEAVPYLERNVGVHFFVADASRKGGSNVKIVLLYPEFNRYDSFAVDLLILRKCFLERKVISTAKKSVAFHADEPLRVCICAPSNLPNIADSGIWVVGYVADSLPDEYSNIKDLFTVVLDDMKNNTLESINL